MYFGQFPLSFAACVGQTKICEVIKEAFVEGLPNSSFPTGPRNSLDSTKVQVGSPKGSKGSIHFWSDTKPELAQLVQDDGQNDVGTPTSGRSHNCSRTSLIVGDTPSVALCASMKTSAIQPQHGDPSNNRGWASSHSTRSGHAPFLSRQSTFSMLKSEHKIRRTIEDPVWVAFVNAQDDLGNTALRK
jgi:hypothetical protein